MKKRRPTPAPLVPMPPCITTPACGHCHYCMVAKHGPLYWLRPAR